MSDNAALDRWLGGVHEGDCLELLRELPDCSVETVITDPPAGISFMGKSWDGDKGGRREWIAWLAEVLAECLRVTKPGGTLVCWAIPRTSHWTGMAIEDAGWYPVDVITHHFGNGFPKSHDISKALDRRAGLEREVVGERPIQYPDSDCWGTSAKGGWDGATGTTPVAPTGVNVGGTRTVTAPASDLAREWDGYGTALKPATEFWWLARKPCEGSFAANAEAYGVAGLWVDGARVGIAPQDRAVVDQRSGGQCDANDWQGPSVARDIGERFASHAAGRWPPNVVFSHAPGCVRRGEQRVVNRGLPAGRRIAADGAFGLGGDGQQNAAHGDADGLETVEAWECVDGCPVNALAEQSGESMSPVSVTQGKRSTGAVPMGSDALREVAGYADKGTAARFFPQFAPDFQYVAKAPRNEREVGLRGVLPCVKCGGMDTEKHVNERGDEVRCIRNDNPCVKPIALMEWLCTLTRTPDGGTVLDPFAGSGTTLIAALRLGRPFIGMEQDPAACGVARARLDYHRRNMTPTLPLEAAAGGGE